MDLAAVVCACCVAAGTWDSGAVRFTPEILSEIGRINLGTEGRLYVDAAGLDDSRPPTAPGSDRYRIRHKRPNRGWTIELLDNDGAGVAGAYSFVVPDRGHMYASDIPFADGRTQDGGLLFKEWRFSGAVKGTGVAALDARSGATFEFILQGWGTRCPDAAQFTRWMFRIKGRSIDQTLFGTLAPAQPRPGSDAPLYFPSPDAAVTHISTLLRREDWTTLARYYDLSGTRIDRAELTSGRFFVHAERPPNAHPGLPWKYRHPFTPGFSYRETLTPAEVGVVIVVVGIDIDQGDGRVQRGTQEFAMRESPSGFQILPPVMERIR